MQFLLCSSPFAVPYLQFPQTAIASALARICFCILAFFFAPAYLLSRVFAWVKYCCTIVFEPSGNLPLGKHHCRIYVQSTLEQILLQDFACNLPLGKHHCRNLLAIYALPNIIVRLCSQSTFGQISSQKFACNLPLSKSYCRTLPVILFWPTGCRSICLLPVRNLPKYFCTLSFVLSR